MNSSHYSPSDSLSNNDEMSLLDLWQTFCSGWRLMLIGLVAGSVVAGGYLAMTPGQYEATLLVEVGHMGVAGSVQQIEAVDDAVKRLQSPDFEKPVLKSLGWNGDARERLFKSSLQATSMEGKYIKIKLRSLAPDDARRAAEATFAALASAHRGLVEAVVAKKEQELAATVAEIHDIEALLSRLDRLLGKETPQSDLKGVLMWLQIKEWLQITQNQKDRLLNLRRQESAAREALNPDLMVPTTAFAPVAVSDGPVYPKARRAWVLAGVGGLLLGVLLVTLRSLIGMNRKQLASSGLMDTDRQTSTPFNE